MSTTDNTLDRIIANATFAAHNAALDALRGTAAEMVSCAVRAAITSAVRNGVMIVAPDADTKLDEDGYTVIWAGDQA